MQVELFTWLHTWWLSQWKAAVCFLRLMEVQSGPARSCQILSEKLKQDWLTVSSYYFFTSRLPKDRGVKMTEAKVCTASKLTWMKPFWATCIQSVWNMQIVLWCVYHFFCFALSNNCCISSRRCVICTSPNVCPQQVFFIIRSYFLNSQCMEQWTDG